MSQHKQGLSEYDGRFDVHGLSDSSLNQFEPVGTSLNQLEPADMLKDIFFIQAWFDPKIFYL